MRLLHNLPRSSLRRICGAEIPRYALRWMRRQAPHLRSAPMNWGASSERQVRGQDALAKWLAQQPVI